MESPDIYTIRVQELSDLWGNYFDSFFNNAGYHWNYRVTESGRQAQTQFNRMRISQAAEQFIVMRTPSGGFSQSDSEVLGVSSLNMLYWPKMFSCGEKVEGCKYSTGELSTWGPTPSAYRSQTNPSFEHRNSYFSRVDQSVILPQLQVLKERQLNALHTTTICAYVRPRQTRNVDGNEVPAHAAFLDGAHGQELVERCEHARDVLVGKTKDGTPVGNGSGSDLRWGIRLADVRSVDPEFADRLVESGVKENSWRYPVSHTLSGGNVFIWDPDSKPVPPATGPVGSGTTAIVRSLSSGNATGSDTGSDDDDGGGGAGMLLMGAAALGIIMAMNKKR